MKGIIASCSTLPSRVENENFQKTVTQLTQNKRIDFVYIHYPKFCKRLKIDYPPIPSWMNENEKIKVNYGVEDCGPLTKVAPLFDLFSHDKTTDLGVFLFDDDRLYPFTWIEELLDAFDSCGRSCVVGRQGTLNKTIPFSYDKFNYSKKLKEYSCVKTASGVIYPFSCFPNSLKDAIALAEKYKEQASYRNDDMMLASWCYKTLTPIFIIPVTNMQMEEWYSFNDEKYNDAVSLSAIPNHTKPQIALAQSMIENDDWPIPWPEITIVIVVIVSFILLLAIMALLIKKM